MGGEAEEGTAEQVVHLRELVFMLLERGLMEDNERLATRAAGS
jgi:hypothetical protein